MPADGRRRRRKRSRGHRRPAGRLSPHARRYLGGDLVRVVIVGTLAYAALVALLRISGKRTRTKLNAFDLVVTIALGSTLATVLLSNQVSLAEGITALALLIALQFVITWLSVRSPRFSS